MSERRCDMDERDKAILLAVWDAWKCNGPRWQPIRDLGISDGSGGFRVHGHVSRGTRNVNRVGGGLIQRGWLCNGPGRDKTLRPGPRFGGVSVDPCRGERRIHELLTRYE